MIIRTGWVGGMLTVAAIVALTLGCGGGASSDDCLKKCEGVCGLVGSCDCGECDGCSGDLCDADVRCVPQCVGRECGGDGCGGECGACEDELVCSTAGICLPPCEPECTGKACGSDGCGGECGSCDEGLECSAKGQCEIPCEPDCLDRVCGDDGCGGECGVCGETTPYCQKGVCKVACEPVCDGKECGDDECGGECGECDQGFVCSAAGQCACGGCGGKQCGPDGCGGSCGTCPADNELCVDGKCVCQPNCIERECGSDGCDGSCGTCPLNHVCSPDGTCLCVPNCDGKECGPNGCGALCGQCGCGEECLLYQCEFTACEGKECGLDGCGGSCGSCGLGKACIAGVCPTGDKACDDGNSVAWDGCDAGQLQEFQVNSKTDMGQLTPDVAILGNGNYVVVWEDIGGDLAASAVKARIFTPDGALPQDEFRVNTYEFSAQKAPAVATLPLGGFVIVWQSEGQDGAFNGIYGQRYKDSGAKTGSEFKINSFTNYDQRFPSVDVLKDGGFVVVWEGQGQDGQGFGVFGQRYDANGGATGGEFQLNTETISDQQMATVVGLSEGGFVTLWGSYSSGAIAWDLFGQRWKSDGSKKGAEFAVNAPWSQNNTTMNYQVYPRLAPLGTDGFVAVWHSNLQDGSEDGVYAQRFSASAKVGGEQLVHESPTGNQQYGDVASLPEGGYVVVWQATGKDQSGAAVVARRFTAQGAAEGPEFVLNAYGMGEQTRPRVECFADGSFIAVWQSSPQDGSDSGVYSRRVAADGTWLYR